MTIKSLFKNTFKRTIKATMCSAVSMTMIFSVFTNVKAGSNNVYLEVDCSQEIGQRLHTESYNNITNNVESAGTPDNPGTADMLGQAGLKTKVARNFYTMGSWYTDRTKSITDPVNSDPTNPDLNLYTYGRDISAHLSTMSDAILAVVKCGGASSPAIMGSGSSFNYDEYEEVLKRGLLAFKKNTPKLEYYECENEPNYEKIHRDGSLDLEEYLKHYERAARAVEWVNSQLTPADGQLLKIGGPVLSQYSKSYITQFLDAVKANGYKLDFVAWHHYNEDASVVEKQGNEVKEALRERGMDAVTVISEYGYMGGGADYNPSNITLAKQAAYMTDFAYFAEKGKIDMPINWVTTHVTSLFKNQFLYEPQLSKGTDTFEEYTFDKPYTGRYIKLHGVSDNNSTGDKYFRVKDVKFFDESGEQIPVPITSATPQKVKDTTDGADSTLFSTNSVFGVYIDYDLGSLKTVSKVQIAWGRKDANTPTPAYKFYMKISSDKATYTDLLGKEKYTPYFHTMLMESKLGDTLIKTAGGSLERTGVRVRAAKNSDDKVTMLVWNYQANNTNTIDVALNVKNLPAGFTGKNIRYKSYLIDSINSNLKYNVPAGKVLGDDALITNNDTVIEGAGTASLNLSLAPNAVTLIELTPDTMPAAGIPKLSGIKINGQPINNFDPLITNYNVIINSNAITATIAPVFDSSSVTAAPASANIPVPAGTTTSHIITVTSKDGTSSRNYTVFIRSGADDGLKSVTLSVGVSPAIISGQYSYDFVLPTGGESVQISSAVPTSYAYGATAVVTQQPDIVNGQNTGKVLVTAENGNTKEYVFNFSIAKAPIHGTTLYSNDFEGGSMSVSDWTYNSAVFSICSDLDSMTFSAKPGDNSKNYVAYTRTVGASDYSFEAKIKAATSSSLPGILARVSQDGNSFYMFRIRPVDRQVELTKVINGKLSSLFSIKSSYLLELNKWYLLRMELDGPNIKCYVDNQLVAQGQDTYLTSGGIGFRAANGCFDADDIVVSELPIGDYSFTDNSGSSVTTLNPSTKLNMSIKAMNDTNQYREATLKAALYDIDNQLINVVSTTPQALAYNSYTTLAASIELPSDVTGHHVKVSLWDEMGRLLKAPLLFPVNQPKLLSLKKPVTASQGQSSAGNANNGDDAASRWSTLAGYPKSWKVDLGDIYNITNVDTLWYKSDSRYYKYYIETSNDDVTYTKVVDKTGNSTYGDTSDLVFNPDGKNVNARYVKITITGCSNPNLFVNVNEFKIYGTLDSTPTGLTLDKSSIDMAAPDSQQLTAGLKPYYADGAIVWTSSDDSVASVDAAGLVTAKAVGTTTIAALTVVPDSVYSAACTVRVFPRLDKVTVSTDKAVLKSGDSTKLSVSGIASDGSNIDLNHAQIEFTTDNGQTANVDDTGNVTAVGEGTVNITVNVTLGGVTKKGEIKIIVDNTPPDTSLISKTSADFDKNNRVDIEIIMTLNGNTLTAVRNGESTLIKDTDYTVVGDTVTIPGDYLAKQPVGITLLTFDFSAGADPVLTINVTDSILTKAIISVSDIADIHVPYGTTAVSIGLPAQVEVTLDDTGKMNVDANWDNGNPEYVINKAGTYTFTGTLSNLPQGVINSNNLKAEVKVIVAATYTVSYIANGGTGGVVPVDSNNYKQNDIVIVAGNTGSLEKPGYIFTGWNTKADGTGMDYKDGDTLTVETSNLVLYAQWETSGGNEGGDDDVEGGTPEPEPAPGPAHTSNAVVTGSDLVTNILVNINNNTGNSSVNLDRSTADAMLNSAETVVITLPSLPEVNNYTLEIPAASLTKKEARGALTLSTRIGSITISGNMLNGVEVAGGEVAGITIGEGDKAKLPEDVIKSIGDRPLVQLTLNVGGKQKEWNNPSAPVKVSIPYTPAEAELADPEHIVVWYIDGSGKAVSIPNGRYDPATCTVTFTATHFSYYAVAYVHKIFNDLESVGWARKSIEVMASKGIINGTGKDIYNPAANITRADYLVLLVKTLGLNAEFKNNFDDVERGIYYYEAIGIAKELGIATGSGNNIFKPTESISRQDMMVLTARAVQKFREPKLEGSIAVLDKFSDRGEIAGYAMNSLAALVKEKLISGSADRINPNDYSTRAEAAVFLYRIYNKFPG